MLINTSHRDITQSLTNFQADLLKNQFFLFNSEKPHVVDYYNINKNKSTLDNSLKIAYENSTSNSPLRFNRIKDMYMYGLNKLVVALESGEMGLESSDVTGDAIILPNTIEPYPNDYFLIYALNKEYMFKITEVTPDTFYDGANFWRIQFAIDGRSPSELNKLIVEDFEFHTGTVGSNYCSVVKKTKWDLATRLDNIAVMLKRYYKSLFYNYKVQTYTNTYLYQIAQSNDRTVYFYDPYLIQFIINNEILKNDGDKYIYIGHATSLRPEFNIRYTKSIWYILENKELDNIDSCTIKSTARYISDAGSIFSTRYEDYFEMEYAPYNPTVESNTPAIDIFPSQVIGHILNNQLFDYNDRMAIYNVVIKYMNNKDLTIEDIVEFEKISETDTDRMYFYSIPICIFCLEKFIKMLLSKTL